MNAPLQSGLLAPEALFQFYVPAIAGPATQLFREQKT